MAFTFHPIDEASARAFLAWCYEPPYDLYKSPKWLLLYFCGK
jgi:hypothetical protein